MKNRIIKFIFIGIGVVFISLISAGPVFAIDVVNPSCPSKTQLQNGATEPNICENTDGTSGGNPLLGSDGIITIIIEVLSSIAGFIALLMTVIAGIRIITAGGDAATLSEARSSLFHALLSLVLVAVAFTLVRFVIGEIS